MNVRDAILSFRCTISRLAETLAYWLNRETLESLLAESREAIDCIEDTIESLEQEVRSPRISNTEILMFIVGWQGGTLKQLASHLKVAEDEILSADYAKMQDLMRLAQRENINRIECLGFVETIQRIRGELTGIDPEELTKAETNILRHIERLS